MKAKLEVEMPEGCHDCQFCVGTECGVVEGMPTIDLFGEDDIRPKWCPLKPEETVETMHCYPKTGWMPVEEGLPEEGNEVLAYIKHNYAEDGWRAYRVYEYTDHWVGMGNMCEVIAWMPMPEPYRTESKTSWCGICDYAAGGCPEDGNWRHCEKNFQIEMKQGNY